MTDENEEVKNIIAKYFDCSRGLIVDSNGISVNGDCKLLSSHNKIPAKFNKIYGNFDINNNELISLEGSPNYVKGDFDCNSNKLTSLEGAPKSIDGGFNCDRNELTTLKGAPKIVKYFSCFKNKLSSLEGAPSIVDGYFECGDNELTSLNGIPKIINGPFYINVYPHTPLLKILTVTGITEFYFYNNLTSSMSTMLHVLSDLFKEHYGKKNAILKVGLEMMRLGYGSNARL